MGINVFTTSLSAIIGIHHPCVLLAPLLQSLWCGSVKFVKGVCEKMKDHLKPGAFGCSLIKVSDCR